MSTRLAWGWFDEYKNSWNLYAKNRKTPFVLTEEEVSVLFETQRDWDRLGPTKSSLQPDRGRDTDATPEPQEGQ